MINLNLFNLKKGEIIVLKLFKTIASTGLILLGLSTAAAVDNPSRISPVEAIVLNNFNTMISPFFKLKRFKFIMINSTRQQFIMIN